MKRKFLIVSVVALMLSACDSHKAELEQQKALQEATRQELEAAITDRDSLLSLVNQISSGVDQIKSLENILTTEGVGTENSSYRTKILSDIEALQKTLKQRKEQLAELESKLKKSNLTNAKLRETIATLRAQIEEQNAEIDSLKNKLNIANDQIETLNSTVNSLNNTVDTITSQRDAAIDRNEELSNELNTCYYVAASSKELKEHKILESGFLRKTKLMPEDFDQNFFTKSDKRELKTIKLYSKKAKVLSNQPTDSYEIIDNGGQKELKILNPTKFWNLSNYLIVQID